MPKPPSAFAVRVSDSIRHALTGAAQRITPPPFAAMDFITSMWAFQLVYTLTELKVWDAIAAGSTTTREISAAVGVREHVLYRLLRAATNLNVVSERPGRQFALEPIGRALCEDEMGSFRDYLVFMGRHGWRHWGHLLDVARDGERTAVEIARGQRPFEFFTTAAVAEDFNRGMTAVTNAVIDALLAGYNLKGLKKIVDVGGGHGRLLAGILRMQPDARGVLFDLPTVVEASGRILRTLGVADRVEVVGGSFFEGVPPGGDLYVLKTVLHDWSDEDCVKILANLRKAIPGTGRVAVVEAVVPPPGKKHMSKFLDIEMLVHAGGRERTREEYAALLEKAGFKLTRVVGLAGPMSVVEAHPV